MTLSDFKEFLPTGDSWSPAILGGSAVGFLAKSTVWVDRRDGSEYGYGEVRHFGILYVLLAVSGVFGLWARRSRIVAAMASFPAILAAILIVFALAIAANDASGLRLGGFFMVVAATLLLVGSVRAISDSSSANAEESAALVAEEVRDLGYRVTKLRDQLEKAE